MAKATKTGLGVREGDVFAGRVEDGRFGAVHVLCVTKDGIRRGKDSATIVCTRYLGEHPPSIDEPTLRTILRRNRFAYRDEPSVVLVDGPPPEGFVHVGNFPPTKEERALDPEGAYGDDWELVRDVWLEWRWEHDRPAFEAEIAGKRAPRSAPVPTKAEAPRARTRGSKLREPDFWALIAKLDAGALAAMEGADPSPLAKALAKKSAADITEFGELLAEALHRLDARRYAQHAGAAGDSSDGFLYARCYVVARGKSYYDDVLAHPERFPADADFEDLLSVVPDAYLEKTGDDYEGETHRSYETGSNREGWA